MKQIFLIAWREYRQYVFSRGFLLFLVLLPLGFIGVSAALSFAERTQPARYFVIYDETGLYTDDIMNEIEHRRLHALLESWDFYAAAAIDGDARDVLPKPFAPASVDDARTAAFVEAGGVEAAKAAAAPHLRPGAPAFSEPRALYRLAPLPPEAASAENLEAAEQTLRPYLLEEKKIDIDGEGPKPLFAAILIPDNFSAAEGAPPAQYWSRNLTDTALEARVARALDDALKKQRYEEFGVSEAAIAAVEAINANISSFRPDRAPDEAELGLADRIETGLPAAMTYMLLVIIFGVGNLLLTNTIEERSNKIVEILLSSVTANQLMMGKLLGIAAVGLTMPTMFVAGALGVSATIDTGGEQTIAMSVLNALVSSNLLFIYLFYFFCAYAIFSMIFLAIGAISNSLQDAQAYMGPIMLVVFAPMPFMFMVFQEPNGIIATVLTWIPLYTPYAVMMRAAADPPLWEVVGATALMLVFAIFLMRIMGRIFRNAILQASPPKMREVWRLAKKEAG